MRISILLGLLLIVTKSFGQYNITKTEYNETKIREYLDTAKIDQIEGIYKYLSDESNGSEYRLGVVKSQYVYLVILLESNNENWETGDVKAYLEPAATQNVYSLRWIMGDHKTRKESVAFITNPGLIEFNISGKAFMLKLYPKLEQANKSSSNETTLSATGSGFFLSKDGYIATNAHVVKGGTSYEITVVNESFISIKYRAKATLIDEVNDVAILKIEDDNFLSTEEIPYSIVTTTQVGEEVFTIGYPLSSVMGNNYKVSNGIINSNTGIKDDVRYMQISVPIQPGNSGGPLFNKEGNIIGITTAKLNEDAIGQSIENVNYAIKSDYLITLGNMLPDLKLNAVRENSFAEQGKINLEEQVKLLKNFVCLISVYK